MDAAMLDGDIDGLSRAGSRRSHHGTMRKKQSLHRKHMSELGQHIHPKCGSCGALVGHDMKSYEGGALWLWL